MTKLYTINRDALVQGLAYYGYQPKLIAEVTGINVSTIRSTLHRKGELNTGQTKDELLKVAEELKEELHGQE